MGFRAITAQLVLRTALHVGTGNSTEAADDLLRRDAQGRILIPGTALAGSLRTIATRLAPRLGSAPCQSIQEGDFIGTICGCLTCQLFGDVNPQRDHTKGCASRLIIFDAPLEKEPELVIRDGVGIDRVSGAAARKERLKFDLEVVPAATVFALRMELDPNLKGEQLLDLLAVTLAEWQAGRGAVGGRVGRGLGALELRDIRYHEPALDNFDKVVAFLKSGPDWTTSQGRIDWVDQWIGKARQRVQTPSAQTIDPIGAKAIARSWVLTEFTLAAEGPFLINDPVRAGQGGFDHAMLRASYQRDGTPVLPGSSLRGVLRSQAERIARTLATYEAWGENDHPNEQRQALFHSICPACNPLTARTENPVASCNSFVKNYVKSLSMQDRRRLEESGAEDRLCLACRLFGSPWNGSRLRVEDAFLIPGTGQQKVLDFLAIDRFTGGGLDGAKFDAVVLWKPQFKVRLFLENPVGWELGWLALALRDLHEGLATVGFGAAKGFGRMSIQSPQITFGILDASDFPTLPPVDDSKVDRQTVEKALAAGQRLLNGERQFSGLYQTVDSTGSHRAEWLALADGWVQAFHSERQNHPRFADFSLQEDSYFRKTRAGWLSDLYPLEVA